MTIDEAIAELTKQLEPEYSNPHTPLSKAMKLGKEALNREKYNRIHQPSIVFGLLPGETEKGTTPVPGRGLPRNSKLKGEKWP